MDKGFDFKNRKNIITIGIFAFAVLALLQFIYFPKYKEVKRLDLEYKELTGEIRDLYDFIGGRDNLEGNIINIRRELDSLKNAFPSEKDVSNIIKQLNDEAKRFNINVSSLKPENLFIYKDSEGGELKVADYFCKCMPLTMKAEGRYQALGEFLASLEKSRNPMIAIEEADIEKEEKIAPKVKAEINLNTFMLGR